MMVPALSLVSLVSVAAWFLHSAWASVGPPSAIAPCRAFYARIAAMFKEYAEVPALGTARNAGALRPAPHFVARSSRLRGMCRDFVP